MELLPMINFDTALGIHPQAAILRARRAELISSNLANAETPGFQARDFDFNAALESAMNAKGDGMAQAQTASGHMPLGEPSLGGAALEYRTPTQASLDQNSVDVQGERSRFVDNALHYQATMRFIDGSLSGLLRAVRGD
jgi:flagellar basal-body rod protein FlgB